LSQEAYYPAAIRVEALDRVGLLSDILAVTTAQQINIRNARVLTDPKTKTAAIVLTLDITGVAQLESVMAQLDRISDVLRVQRARSA
jgi:GTP pyrophosphokinase